MDTIRPEMARPAPYRVADKREWIVSDESETAGLAILVRTSITNAEQDALTAAHTAIAEGYAAEWNAKAPEDRDLADSPRQRELALLAPYVLDWNAVALTTEGQEVEIAAPAVNGAAAFAAIAASEIEWITRVVLVGYLVTGKAGRSRPRFGSVGDTSEPPSTSPPADPPDLKRRKR